MIKRPWTIYEDNLLRHLVNAQGAGNWSYISTYFADRSAKACRAPWCDQLSPELNHLPITLEEHRVIAQAHAEICNSWAVIATRLNGRTANAVKNHWQSALRWKYSTLIMQNEEDDQFRANREAVPRPSGPALNNSTWLSLGMPGFGFEDEPVAQPIMRSPEPVNVELSLSLGQGDGGIRAEGPVVKEINFFV
ncbi:transcription factor MYB77-like [Bidens hawaiensis]|uniref:transcription factor MYB77-like n=1 Tax=Bidens hawaiensis TaxID=980011 RepID=UPI004049C0B0